MDFSVIYYIESSVVALFSVNPMSVKVMHDCIKPSNTLLIESSIFYKSECASEQINNFQILNFISCDLPVVYVPGVRPN